MFYLTKNTFDTVPISMSFVSEIEAMSLTGVVQRLIAINEKHGVIDVVTRYQCPTEC